MSTHTAEFHGNHSIRVHSHSGVTTPTVKVIPSQISALLENSVLPLFGSPSLFICQWSASRVCIFIRSSNCVFHFHSAVARTCSGFSQTVFPHKYTRFLLTLYFPFSTSFFSCHFGTLPKNVKLSAAKDR